MYNYLIKVVDSPFTPVIVQYNVWFHLAGLLDHWLAVLSAQEEHILPPLWHIRYYSFVLREAKQRGKHFPVL